MSPPPFSDLGKSAKDLFNKGYAHGFIKLEVKTKSGPFVEFKSDASHNLSSQKLNGNLEVKYKAPEHGLTVTEKWNTENQLSTVIEVNNKIARGLKVSLDTSYTPHNAKRGAILKSEYTGESIKANADLTLLGGPIFNVAAVMQLKHDWLFGAQAKFDLTSNEIKTSQVAVGRCTPEYTLHSFTVDGRDFGASIYHRVHKNCEYGVQLGWKMGEQGATWGLASKYQASLDLILRAKIDNKSQVSLAATHSLSDAAKLTLSTHFGLGLPDASNKFGVGIEYAP